VWVSEDLYDLGHHVLNAFSSRVHELFLAYSITINHTYLS
jgi:hypothetical protein